MRDFDVIVVGAGPAGCAAAYDIAAAGLRVLLLDRKAFPRLKPCAGALTIKAVKRLRYSIAPVMKWVARDLEVTLNGRGRSFHGDHPIAVMTVRQELDAFCLEQTLRKGALFERIEDVTGITESQDGVMLTTSDGEHLQCGHLIGADGVNSRVRRLLGYGPVAKAVALEGEVASPRGGAPPPMRFDFGHVPGGYGWVFPKGGHLNVGLYTQGADRQVTKKDLVAYAGRALGAERVERMIGYPVGIGGETYHAGTQRIFLAGDAAGMSERLLGEGIHNALKTGQLAAHAIIAAANGESGAWARYSTELEAVRRDLKTCQRAAVWFYDRQFLGLARWFPIPRGAALMRGFAAGLTFREIMHSGWFAPPYSVESVAAVEEFEAVARVSPAVA